jgi:tRNA threonylcarbamoyladenosine biosynthesis protein TsaB
MLLLVTDTSGKHGTVALVRAGPAGGSEIRLMESVPLAGGTFSAQLVPQIAGLLSKHGLHQKAIEGFIAISGPGSFTGLRVGLAAIKALAEILEKPIVPLSLLEVIAIAANTEGNLLAVLDAGRGEVYTGEYIVGRGAARNLSEELLPRDAFLSARRGLVVSTADTALAQTAREVGMTVHQVTVDAESIARLGWRKMQSGETVAPEQLDANYIRRSDAEIFSKPIS